MGGRPGLAEAFLGAALGLSEQLAAGDDVSALQTVLQSELGDALRAAGRPDEARNAYAAALAIAEEDGDRRAEAAALDHLLALADGQPEEVRARYQAARARLQQTGEANASDGAGFAVTLHDELITDCVFDTDLLVDVARAAKITPWTETPEPLSDDIRPMMPPCTRAYVDDEGAARFCLPLAEPVLERHPDCVVMRKTIREVAVSGAVGIIWRLVRAMDGARTVKELLAGLPADERKEAARVLAVLAACGVVDVSGRALGRFVHSATKKGVLLGGGLAGDEVLRLATDGNYRTYAHASHIALGEAVPERLRPFHAVTRMRRSRRHYAERALSREDFEALLHTACGVTGAMPWEGRDLKLRAYPSSGALYAVEIYPVVLRVDELEPGVYHYVPGENLLDAVVPGADAIVGASLPVERQMVSGAAAMICLVGQFRRHERKYGEGGYRMMVAEAGHISQNLVLAATALGLAARPFGGVFDGLMNRALNLDEDEEQFLLSVLVGHAGEAEGTGAQTGIREGKKP
jgi:SagB-type dehydrogenase family enzyme